jgi:trehalose 6-phosphate synthase
VAHGSGDADHTVCDQFHRVAVPPDDPSYTLRRVWLTPKQEAGYYYGFANDTLWPLCHQVYHRPTFDPAHWATYQEVNRLFARTVLEEAGDGPALVFVQDYHFALLPRLIKDVRSDITVAQFWHIPWPNSETFGVCPWAAELLDGMLGNDLLSFHIRHHCNNFLDTVDRTVECRIDRERFGVWTGGHATLVQPHPISVDPDLAEVYLGDSWAEQAHRIRARFGLGDRPLLIGVDRLDYTKGIPERLRAVDHLLNSHPERAGTFQFFQLTVPSRAILPVYQGLEDEVVRLAESVNAKHGTTGWKPIVLVTEHWNPTDVFALYRTAVGCVVSSLHDGMNLVAKEFVSARTDEQGALVLSTFTGAARELTDAILVNPFDVNALADGMLTALVMPPEEQRQRIGRMRRDVRYHSVYRWAGRLLSEAAALTPTKSEPNSAVFARRPSDVEPVLAMGVA